MGINEITKIENISKSIFDCDFQGKECGLLVNGDPYVPPREENRKPKLFYYPDQPTDHETALKTNRIAVVGLNPGDTFDLSHYLDWQEQLTGPRPLETVREWRKKTAGTTDIYRGFFAERCARVIDIFVDEVCKSSIRDEYKSVFMELDRHITKTRTRLTSKNIYLYIHWANRCFCPTANFSKKSSRHIVRFSSSVKDNVQNEERKWLQVRKFDVDGEKYYANCKSKNWLKDYLSALRPGAVFFFGNQEDFKDYIGTSTLKFNEYEAVLNQTKKHGKVYAGWHKTEKIQFICSFPHPSRQFSDDFIKNIAAKVVKNNCK